MIDIDRPFTAGAHPARAYLLQKALFSLLAFDAFLTMLSHGGRYGMGGFNVSHVAWLDRWLPVPSAAFYTGLTLLVGLLSSLHVLLGGPRSLRVAIAVLYSLAWMVSLFDSYQHHYLLSWLLLWTAFMPTVPAEAAQTRDAASVQGWGVPMTAITCGIVYAFTVIAKSEADFRAGHVLIRLSRSRPRGDVEPGVLDPLRDLCMSLLGTSEAGAWALLAHTVIALQITLSLGYFAATTRDASRSLGRRFACGTALVAAVSFHAFAQLGGMFDIGWFSYYMLCIGFAVLAPAPALAACARVVAWPGRAWGAWLERRAAHTTGARSLAQAVASAVVLCGLGFALDLPGAKAACGVVAAVVFGACLVALRTDRPAEAQRVALSGALAAAACWGAVTFSDARYDYYRRAGGELRAMGALESALAMYRKAERYAGPGRSRKSRIMELEQMIRAAPRESD